jgi:hypothetical protein
LHSPMISKHSARQTQIHATHALDAQYIMLIAAAQFCRRLHAMQAVNRCSYEPRRVAGDCPPCKLSAKRTCQCGAETASVPCAVPEFRCARVCGSLGRPAHLSVRKGANGPVTGSQKMIRPCDFQECNPRMFYILRCSGVLRVVKQQKKRSLQGFSKTQAHVRY